MAKLTVIGLDGVNWRILDHALNKGLMPNLADIIDSESSTKAELETTYPPVTGPAWTSIMTGDNPGKHSVFDFVDHVEGGKPYNSSDIETDTIYEMIVERGEATIVNLPISYPPKFDGQFVGSFLAPEDDFVRPESLKEIFDHENYKKSLTAMEKSLDVIKASRRVAEDKKELMESILDDQDFFFMLFSAPDWMMHNHYHRMKDGEVQEAYKVFELMDEAIGEAYERSDNIVLLSDHGFNDFQKVFYPNQWLKEQGYLETEGSMDLEWADNAAIEKILGIATKSPFRSFSRKAYFALEDLFPFPENVKVRLSSAFSEGIDMENSRAFCPSSGIRGIYINDDRFEGVENEDIVDEIIEKLPDYLHPLRREEVFDGPFTGKAPDIVFEEKGHRISRGIYGKVESDRQVNHHGRRGFFLADGENFKSADIEFIDLYDVAPTIADLFDIEFEADGEVLPIVDKKLPLLEKKIIPDTV